MQDGRKSVWSLPYVSVAFFPSLKQNYIAYRTSNVSSRPDCIFEIHQLWQSGFSRVYSNYCCSCWFEPEIIKISLSSHKMYSNNILNYQESTTILNAHTKKVWKLIVCPSYSLISKPSIETLNWEGNNRSLGTIPNYQWNEINKHFSASNNLKSQLTNQQKKQPSSGTYKKKMQRVITPTKWDAHQQIFLKLYRTLISSNSYYSSFIHVTTMKFYPKSLNTKDWDS